MVSRIQKILFRALPGGPGDWTPVIATTITSIVGLACAIGVFVCLGLRIKAATAAQPIHAGKWTCLGIGTLAFASEPVVTLWVYAARFLERL